MRVKSKHESTVITSRITLPDGEEFRVERLLKGRCDRFLYPWGYIRILDDDLVLSYKDWDKRFHVLPCGSLAWVSERLSARGFLVGSIRSLCSLLSMTTVICVRDRELAAAVDRRDREGWEACRQRMLKIMEADGSLAELQRDLREIDKLIGVEDGPRQWWVNRPW